MRVRTGVLVGLGSVAAVTLSWFTGLGPRHAAVVGGAHIEQPAVVVPTTSGPVPTGRATRTTAPVVVSGTVDGAVVDTQYGAVQVQVGYTGRRITRIRALHLTDSSGTSVQISAGAAPILRREALAAQSAHVDMVSGATFTSTAYLQSLQSALDAAHLG